MSLFITGVEDGREFTMMFDKANFFLMVHEYDEAPRDCRKLGNDQAGLKVAIATFKRNKLFLASARTLFLLNVASPY
jgi:hypothetical protein